MVVNLTAGCPGCLLVVVVHANPLIQPSKALSLSGWCSFGSCGAASLPPPLSLSLSLSLDTHRRDKRKAMSKKQTSLLRRRPRANSPQFKSPRQKAKRRRPPLQPPLSL